MLKLASKLFGCLIIVILNSCAEPAKKLGSAQLKESVAAKKLEALLPLRFTSLFERGTDFLATGSEPFWSLDINFDSSMHFKMADGFETIAANIKALNNTEPNTVVYSAKSATTVLTVKVQKTLCINEMSGEKLDYHITIKMKSNIDKITRVFKGCGRYLADYRLHDIWVLDSMANKKIVTKDFIKGSPLLEINLTENKFYGTTGCNSVNGLIEVKGKKISFDKLSTINIACNNEKFESSYVEALSSKTITYKINSGKLYLRTTSGSEFVFKKID